MLENGRGELSPPSPTTRILISILRLVLVVPLLASCTSVEIEDHSLQFNQATGSLGSRLLLLNAVRAAKGYPLQFSKVTSYQGQSRVDGNLSLNLPFILNTFGAPSATRLQGTATPSASLKTGVQNLQLTDLNTAEIQKQLRKQVTANDFAYYRSQGWPKALVNTILIESVYVNPRLLAALTTASKLTCRNTSGSAKREAECRWLRNQKHEPCVERRASQDGDTVLEYANDPRRYCEYMSFQRFFTSIRVLEAVSLDLDPKVDPNECKTVWLDPRDSAGSKDSAKEGKEKKGKSKDAKGEKSEGMSESVKEGKISVDVNVKIAEKADKDDDSSDKTKDGIIGLNIPRDLNIAPKKMRGLEGTRDVSEAYRDQLEGLGKLRNEYLCLLKEGKTPILFTYRSPERMVRFLGDVLAVHTLGSGDRKGPIQVLNEDGISVDLFRVEKGRDFLGNRVAVSVEGPDRENFYIPIPGQDSDAAHMSLQAMALVMESLNLAVSGKALPQPATFFLSGG